MIFTACSIVLQYRQEETPFLKSIDNELSLDARFIGKFEENLKLDFALGREHGDEF